jgi:hypothetical protein
MFKPNLVRQFFQNRGSILSCLHAATVFQRRWLLFALWFLRRGSCELQKAWLQNGLICSLFCSWWRWKWGTHTVARQPYSTHACKGCGSERTSCCSSAPFNILGGSGSTRSFLVNPRCPAVHRFAAVRCMSITAPCMEMRITYGEHGNDGWNGSALHGNDCWTKAHCIQ